MILSCPFPLGVTSVSQQTETSLWFDLRQLVCKNLLAEGHIQSNNFPNLSTQMFSEGAKWLADQNLYAHSHRLLVAEVVSIGQQKKTHGSSASMVLETFKYCLAF